MSRDPVEDSRQNDCGVNDWNDDEYQQDEPEEEEAVSRDISTSNQGPSSESPYVPSWLYEFGTRVCACGDHEGYHNDAGICLRSSTCRCPGFNDSGARKEAK